jgi:transketolase
MAGHWKLNRLIVLYDDNGISIDGPLSIADSVDQVKRFKACGWAAELIDGHDPAAIEAAIARAQKSSKPTLIACKTTIGFGAPTKAGTSKVHGEALGADELKGAKEKLGISLEPFSVPDDVLAAWREAGRRGAPARTEWETRLNEMGPRKRADFERRLRHERPAALAKAFKDFKKGLLDTPLNIATRKSSEAVIEVIAAAMPFEFLAGSADLTGSNNNKAKSATAFSAKTPKGRFIHYGIREHGMAAAMNGIFLHGGFAPNGATFLVFSDYARPAMRLAALMGAGVVYVMTHDSIGLGEDGPTHQPVEHLAALRAIPNMRVFRPCDAIETAECWELALNRIDGPTVLALTRQNLLQLRTSVTDNPCSRGGYELVAASGEAKVSLFASGSEVEIAVAAQKQLAERGIAARVVSVPALELLLAQPAEVRAGIIGNAPVRIEIEAAVRWGWDAVIGTDGDFVGMHSFGESGPAKELYKHFGITAEAAVAAAVKRLS